MEASLRFHKSSAVASSSFYSSAFRLGTGNYEIPEPSSVYSRKQSAAKRKSTCKENDEKSKTRWARCSIQITISRVSSSAYDAINCNVYEPHSMYDRRKTAKKRKSNGKENVGASSCPPAMKIRNTGDNSNEDAQNRLAKKSKAPCRERVLPAKKETSGYTSPELEKQKAYFAELDEYELEEAEESELDE